MSEILYIQTEKNVEVYQPEVYLQDVAKLACGDSKVLNRNKIRKVFSIPDERRAVCDFLRQTWSAQWQKRNQT